METVQGVLLSIWIHIIEWPIGLRVVIPLVIFGLVAAYFLSLFLPGLTYYLIRFIKKVLDVLFTIFLYPEYLVAKLRRRLKKKPFSFNYSIGDTFQTISITFEKLVNHFPSIGGMRRVLFKHISRTLFLVAGIVLVLLLMNPSMNNSALDKWLSFEEWVLENADEKVANAQELKSEIEEEGHKEVYYVLTEEYQEGANIRKNPGLDAPYLTMALPNEQLLFLGEKQPDGNRTWLKIENTQGQVGWISDVVVMEWKES